MNPFHVLPVVFLALVTVVAVVTRPPQDAEGASFITVTAVRQSRTMTGAGPPGRLGDVTDQSWSMRDRHGNTIGSFHITCHWTTPGIRLCLAEGRFEDGSLVGAGTVETPLSGTLAVTGGTGRYRHADGQATFTALTPTRMVVSIALE